MLQYIKSLMQRLSNVSDLPLHKSVFIYAMYASYILIIIAITDVIYVDPSYLSTIDTFIKYYVSLFLIARFNPFVDTKFTDFDAKLAYSAGIFLLITTSAFQIIKSEVSKKINITS